MGANFAPKDCVALFDAVYKEQDYAKARAIYQRILPLLELLESFPKSVQANKYIVKHYCNLETGYVRRPRLELTKEEIEYVEGLASTIDFH